MSRAAPATARDRSGEDLFALGAPRAAGARRGARARAAPSCARGSCSRRARGAARATPPSRTSRRRDLAGARRLGRGARRGRGRAGRRARRRGLRAAADAGGARSLWRRALPQRRDRRRARSARLRGLARARGLRLWGLHARRPSGEPYGLDTLRFFALCRLALPASRTCRRRRRRWARAWRRWRLGFGADELFAPIVAERALRLGAQRATTRRSPARRRRR